MKSRDLNSFFSPKSIAVIGASPTPGKVGHTLMNKLKNFKGKIIPINPNHQEILGIKTYKSISAYKQKIDLTLIAIPSKFVKKSLLECAKQKITNIIIISAGFSETGNKKEEEELIQIAKKHNLNILGPNCFGIVNTALNIACTFANSTPKKGSIAFISQSGALWSYISDMNPKEGFSGMVSLGNMSDLNFSDWIEYFNKHKQTKKIILYLEALDPKSGKEFIEICKRSKKPIIAIKSGKTEVGREATISHTASLATDHEIYKGAFKQAGIKQVMSVAEAFGIQQDKIKNPKPTKTFIVTNAGGVGALIADKYSKQEFNVSPPLDLIGTALAKDYQKALNTKTKSSELIITILTPQTMSQPVETAKVISEFKKQNPKKKIIAYFLGNKSIKEAKQILLKNKIETITKI